jgi:tetratricopeptide (TPR) repeat protein
VSLISVAVILLAQLAAPGPQGAGQELESLLGSAGAALEAGDLLQAESGFERAASMAPASPLAHLGLCEVEIRRERPLEALRHCRESQRLAPEAPLPALRVAQLLSQVGSRDEALQAFARARELDPAQPAAWIVPALLLRDRGEAEAAVALLQEGLPTAASAELCAELGLLLLRLGQPAQAASVAAEALERWPDAPGLTLTLGLALAVSEDRGDRDRAVALLEQALARGAPNAGRVRLELGRLLLELDRGPEALEHLRLAARALPGEPEVHYRLGQALQLTGDAAGARDALARFQELSGSRDDGEWAARGVLGGLKRAQQLALEGQVLAALEQVDSVLSEHPGVPQALALRARLLGSLGRESEALEAARAAREGAPGAADHHYLEGLFLIRSGELDAGEAALERALDLDPDIAEAWELLAAVAQARGRHGAAVERLRAALALRDDPGLRRSLADALEALGRLDEARTERAAAARLDQS